MTKKIKPIKYNDEQIEAAKELYFNYTPLKEIEEKTGVTVRSVKHYANRYWKEERETRKSDIIEALTESKKGLMFEITKNGLEVLNRAMSDLLKGDRPLTPREMTGIANIINDLDKIHKLDEGNPTDIVADIKPASIVEIKKLIESDPFMEIEDASFEEVKSEENDSKDTE
jgi:hypothetical protein